MKQIASLIALAAALSACGNGNDPIVAGELADPMEEELAAADPVDPASVPMGVGSDDYRCKGSNQLVKIDWIRTGDVMSARVTPMGERGTALTQGADGGAYTNDDASLTMTGTPTSDSVTLNGSTCTK